MKKFLLFSAILFTLHNHAQTVVSPLPTPIDSLYREDQFYVGLSYNIFGSKPREVRPSGFSGGLHLGFIRDMPINERRNMAIGLGLGISTHRYNTNLRLDQPDDEITENVILENRSEIDRNFMSMTQVDVPLQIRWRTSSVNDYNFWRIYTGVRFSYILTSRNSYAFQDADFVERPIENLEPFRYAATLTIGNGSVNGFVLYNFNGLLNSAEQLNGRQLNLNPLKIGLEFYFL